MEYGTKGNAPLTLIGYTANTAGEEAVELSFVLGRSWASAVDELAKAAGITRTEFIRCAIERAVLSLL